MSRRRDSRLAATVSLAITLILGWVVVSAVVWRQTADAETPPRREPPPPAHEVEMPAPEVAEHLYEPVILPPPPAPQAPPKRVAEIPDAPAVQPEAVVEEAPVEPEPVEPEPVRAEPVEAEPIETEQAQVVPVREGPRQFEPVQVAAAPVPVTPDRAMVREGRVLLKLLERGEGPDIEIAWPEEPGARAELYRVFDACFGMRTVVVGPDGGLYTEDLPPGRAWMPDPDGVSGYARQPRGALPAGERARVDAIRSRHRLSGGTVIRVFPRDVDAGFLGALEAVATDAYRSGGRFRASYELAPSGVRITGIRANGREIGQPVLLGGAC